MYPANTLVEEDGEFDSPPAKRAKLDVGQASNLVEAGMVTKPVEGPPRGILKRRDISHKSDNDHEWYDENDYDDDDDEELDLEVILAENMKRRTVFFSDYVETEYMFMEPGDEEERINRDRIRYKDHPALKSKALLGVELYKIFEMEVHEESLHLTACPRVQAIEEEKGAAIQAEDVPGLVKAFGLQD